MGFETYVEERNKEKGERKITDPYLFFRMVICTYMYYNLILGNSLNSKVAHSQDISSDFLTHNSFFH
jgi:hypothetical protein